MAAAGPGPGSILAKGQNRYALSLLCLHFFVCRSDRTIGRQLTKWFYSQTGRKRLFIDESKFCRILTSLARLRHCIKTLLPHFEIPLPRSHRSSLRLVDCMSFLLKPFTSYDSHHSHGCPTSRQSPAILTPLRNTERALTNMRRAGLSKIYIYFLCSCVAANQS